MPRLPLGVDDEFVFKVARGGPEEAESTWEPVSRVFDGETAVLRKELKAPRLKMDQNREFVRRYGLGFDHIVVWGGSRMLNCCFSVFIESSNFKIFLLGISAQGADST